MKKFLSFVLIAVGSVAIVVGCGQPTKPVAKDSDKKVAPEEKPAAKDAKEEKIAEALAKLSPEDRKLAEEQKFCVQSDKSRLGSMGTPVKIELEGQSVFLCCKGCEKEAKANPQETLAKVEKLKAANK